MIRATRILACGVLAVSLAAAVPAAAQTATTTPSRRSQVQSDRVAVIKARAKAEIDRRLVTLGQLATLVDSARHLSAGNRSTLDRQLADARSGLTALGTKIEDDTDLQTLVTDARSIVTGYRIYLLVTPKVYEVMAADRILAVTDTFDSVLTRIEGRIKSDGDKALVADAKAKVADAKSKAQGVPGAVIDLLPSGYPGNRPTLVSARKSLQAARQDLLAARQDVAQLAR